MLTFSSFVPAALAQPAPAQPPPAPPAAAAAPATTTPALPSIDDPMLAEPPPPQRTLRSWKEGLSLVRQNATSLRTSAARVAQSEALARQALAGALPTLTGTAGINHHLLRGERTVEFTDGTTESSPAPKHPTTWNAGLDLRVPVFAPSVWYEHGTAKRQVDVTKLSTKELERQELAGVANSIVSVVTAERLAEVSRVSLKSALSTLDLNKRRAALGASSALDVLRVEQEVQLTRAQVVAADEGLIRAREALGLALGTSESWGVTRDIRIDQLATDAKSSCRQEQNVASRPDVRAAQANVELAARKGDGNDWRYWPTVDAVSSLTYWSHHNDISPNGDPVTWTVGGLLTWQLYDGGLRYAQRDVDKADVLLAQEQLTDTRRRAEIEITQAARAVRVAEQNLAVSARSREIAAETARLSKVAYLNGSGTSFDLVDTARRLREAELDLAIKEFEVLRARIAALLALASCNV
jgi:outer membrane protein TolC